MKISIKNILSIILLALVFWVSFTTGFQAASCDKLTQTELFERIPNSFVLKFVSCQ